MAAPRKRQLDRTALDLVEEAARLLRRVPGGVLLRFYIGSVPCILGLLYFFTDVTRGAFAQTHLLQASLGAAALYVWMKCWHAGFNNGLLACLTGEPPAPWTTSRITRLVCVQAAVQPSGLFVRLFALIALLPYVWVYGFYQGCGVFGDGAEASVREVSRRAWAQAKWQPLQATVALSYLKVFAFFVFLNVMVLIFIVPQLLRMFTGIETVFTLSPVAMLNSTVLVAALGMTYLCFDPLRKALYVLRCFYADAVRTGQDIEVGLKAVRAPAAARFAAAALLLFAFSPGSKLRAADAPPIAEHVDSAKLSDTIEDVLNRREFTWRLPHEKEAAAEKSWLEQFVDESIRSFQKAVADFRRWLDRFFRKFRKADSDEESGGFGWSTPGVLYTAIAVSIGCILYFLWKQRRSLRVAMIAAKPIAVVPDLRSDDVVADQLPEDGWLALARELIEKGELRLALRASYLAGLAHLGRRELITIARHKSNLDYERELRRRARSRDELLTAFDANLDSFERAWYGLHEVTRETLGGFNENLDRIRAC